MSKLMYLYIMGNNRPTLYTGVTSNLIKRVYEHKNDLVKGFTKKYQLHDLLYYESVEGELQGIIREKQVKDMDRIDKLNMIKMLNPKFKDLYPDLISADSGVAPLPRMTNKNNQNYGKY